MKTIKVFIPAVFGAESPKHNPEVPAGTIRLYLARVEIMDVPGGDEIKYKKLETALSDDKLGKRALDVLSRNLIRMKEKEDE